MSESPIFMLTRDGQAALDLAAAIARYQQRQVVEPVDLLAALLLGKATLVPKVLGAIDVDLAQLQTVANVPTTAPRVTQEPLPPSPATSAIIGYAAKESQHLGHGSVDAIHLLMGMLYENGAPTYQLLTDAGVTLYDLRQELAGRAARMKQSDERPTVGAIRPSPIFFIPLLLMIGAGWALCTNPQPGWVKPLTFLFAISGWITALCIHEFGHAIVAYFGGDTSVRNQGYLTLNPLKYTHPFYSLVIPLIFMFMGGIGLPGAAVYINRFALRNAWVGSLYLGWWSDWHACLHRTDHLALCTGLAAMGHRCESCLLACLGLHGLSASDGADL
ncbi:MAG: Clp protease N-terminal domain-containing protein [Caldilineaceae bacterium]